MKQKTNQPPIRFLANRLDRIDSFVLTLAQAQHEICDIGRRLYARQFAAANDGNISYRLSDDGKDWQILCTPTMHSKGFLKPEDLVIVDRDGNRIGGQKKPSSEMLLHLAIYEARPDVMSVVHCHPPHAAAFAFAGEPIPAGIAPEVEIFLGEVPTAPYALTGTAALADSAMPFVHQTNVMLLANHGTVSYGETIERAYWWTEVLDHYCQVLLNAQKLGGAKPLTKEQVWELIEVKKAWGMKDARHDEKYKETDPRDRPVFGK